MATTATRKKKSIADLKADLEAAKRKVALLEQKAYQGQLSELIKSANFVADYKAVKAALDSVSDVAILTGIAKACGAKHIQITQVAPVKRPRKPKSDISIKKVKLK